MIIAFTGHRKIDDTFPPSEAWTKIGDLTKIFLLKKQPASCISGMSLGFDQVAARICVELGIPFIAAIPCPDQDIVWPRTSRLAYREILKKAIEVVTVSNIYSNNAMQKRNRWMVDNSDEVLACWSGRPGGTANCIKYVKMINRPITYIDPDTFIVSGG